MLPFLQIFPVAQIPPSPPPQEVVQPQEVRPLPGSLDTVPVFNSNSPELVQTEGILLSTFPPTGKRISTAHLNFPLQGRFDIFAHHVAKATSPEDLRTLYLGVILHNPSNQPVKVDVLQAASYLSQPDAPFIELPPLIENLLGTVFAGPGDRVMNDLLRGQRQAGWPAFVVIPPKQSQILLNLPIPVQGLEPPINGRSTLMQLRSSGVVYAASLAMYAPLNPDGTERSPTLAEWQQLLDSGDLAGPRDRPPTPPEQTTGSVVYGRVAGVAQGSQWQAQLVDRSDVSYLSIPQPGQAFSYGLSTLNGGRLGTEQVQSAPLLVRYPDTAYRAHGNYGIQYSLSLPLYNNTGQPQTVTLSIQTPVKEDQLQQRGLRFLNPPASQVFFRGTVRLRYNDDRNLPQTRYVHLVQKRGQPGEPLLILQMRAGDRRLVLVDFLYPPDSTPPQVLTLKTLDSTN
ncbi:DUF3370 domain-containing protein [Chroococcidiopsis sp. CCMEE 29]|uniref:DUF3370 domain-containing protein n=1 Tax=Chroococcidiopsis sp. CCMEE 29 TaxID=155894 RepID=UPI00202037B2|nr:DUF3370 domain-containing protein [Chroococcidiopsis sp. CCMEE 29]